MGFNMVLSFKVNLMEFNGVLMEFNGVLMEFDGILLAFDGIHLSGKRLHNYGEKKTQFLMGKITIPMTIFTSYVSLSEGKTYRIV